MKFDSVFAPAEEFSELIEAASAARAGTSGAVSNKDKACKSIPNSSLKKKLIFRYFLSYEE